MMGSVRRKGSALQGRHRARGWSRPALPLNLYRGCIRTEGVSAQQQRDPGTQIDRPAARPAPQRPEQPVRPSAPPLELVSCQPLGSALASARPSTGDCALMRAVTTLPGFEGSHLSSSSDAPPAYRRATTGHWACGIAIIVHTQTSCLLSARQLDPCTLLRLQVP
jgi:hypothetical protein